MRWFLLKGDMAESCDPRGNAKPFRWPPSLKSLLDWIWFRDIKRSLSLIFSMLKADYYWTRSVSPLLPTHMFPCLESEPPSSFYWILFKRIDWTVGLRLIWLSWTEELGLNLNISSCSRDCGSGGGSNLGELVRPRLRFANLGDRPQPGFLRAGEFLPLDPTDPMRMESEWPD